MTARPDVSRAMRDLRLLWRPPPGQNNARGEAGAEGKSKEQHPDSIALHRALHLAVDAALAADDSHGAERIRHCDTLVAHAVAARALARRLS